VLDYSQQAGVGNRPPSKEAAQRCTELKRTVGPTLRGLGGLIMKRNLLAILLVSAIAAPVFGHHSEAAEYDSTKPVKVTGTIKKVEWQNPHVWFYVDVKDENGQVTTWGFSAAPPGALLRRGITKDNLPLGVVVNVEGSRARDGSNNASSHRVTFSDGRNVLTATGEGGR